MKTEIVKIQDLKVNSWYNFKVFADDCPFIDGQLLQISQAFIFLVPSCIGLRRCPWSTINYHISSHLKRQFNLFDMHNISERQITEIQSPYEL